MKRSLLLRDEDESFHLRIRRRRGSVKVVVAYARVVVPCLSRRLAARVSGGGVVPGWEPHRCDGGVVAGGNRSSPKTRTPLKCRT